MVDKKIGQSMQLALETSTNICSVAFRDNAGKVYERRTEVRGSHSEQLFLFVEELKKKHGFAIKDLQSVIVSEGPGSYTGLRISASAVKGLLFKQDITLLAANTLSSFAAGIINTRDDELSIHSIINARRVHVYHQQFTARDNELQAISRVEVKPIKEFEHIIEEGDRIIGTGIERLDLDSAPPVTIFDESYISAGSLFRLQELDTTAQLIREADIQSFEPRYYSSSQPSTKK